MSREKNSIFGAGGIGYQSIGLPMRGEAIQVGYPEIRTWDDCYKRRLGVHATSTAAILSLEMDEEHGANTPFQIEAIERRGEKIVEVKPVLTTPVKTLRVQKTKGELLPVDVQLADQEGWNEFIDLVALAYTGKWLDELKASASKLPDDVILREIEEAGL